MVFEKKNCLFYLQIFMLWNDTNEDKTVGLHEFGTCTVISVRKITKEQRFFYVKII